MADPGTGTLFVVSTPIGNLGDMTYRAVETLKDVSLIAAEDTRRTRVLLNHYGLNTATTSFNSYNQDKKTRELLKRLEGGDSLAIVTDAGTPGVSDPLFSLVRAVLDAGFDVVSIPGASAPLAALTASGLPMDRFWFEGFLPRKKGRTKKLEFLASLPSTVVLFESPNRMDKTLADLLEHFGKRDMAIARELTKLHEEIIRGDIEDLLNTHRGRKWKGEITLVISAPSKKLKTENS